MKNAFVFACVMFTGCIVEPAPEPAPTPSPSPTPSGLRYYTCDADLTCGNGAWYSTYYTGCMPSAQSAANETADQCIADHGWRCGGSGGTCYASCNGGTNSCRLAEPTESEAKIDWDLAEFSQSESEL